MSNITVNNMDKFLFSDWHQFKVCFLSGCKSFLWGLYRIVSALFFGLMSLTRYLWRRLVKAVAKYPKSTIFIVVVTFALVWGYTYTRMKARLTAAEFGRDSIAYKLSRFEAMYDNDTDSVIIVRKTTSNDTIKMEK